MSNDAVPVAWFKHGPYEDGEPLTCVFDDPGDEDCYTALVPQSTVTALQARIAELERDAARYRWLRDNPEHESAPYFDGAKWVIPRMTGNAGGIGGGDGEDRFDSLDTAIDAAIEATK